MIKVFGKCLLSAKIFESYCDAGSQFPRNLPSLISYTKPALFFLLRGVGGAVSPLVRREKGHTVGNNLSRIQTRGKKKPNKPNQESNLSYATQVPSRFKRATAPRNTELRGKD